MKYLLFCLLSPTLSLVLIADAAAQASLDRSLFDADAPARALTLLGIIAPPPAAEIIIDTPEISENGADVPVHLQLPGGNKRQLLVIAGHNPRPVALSLTLAPSILPDIRFRLKMAESAPVITLLRDGDDPWQQQQRQVGVTIGGCGPASPPVADAAQTPPAVTQPTRIRAALKNGITDVRLRAIHSMESGFRHNARGETLAPHYIQRLVVRHNEKIVLDAAMNGSVATNPYLAFQFKGGQHGDLIDVSWEDNLGYQRSDKSYIQ